VKDAVNTVWWFSKTPNPKASNKKVLTPYSDSMKALLKSGYNKGLRPSGHDISDNFSRDNGGAIPANLLLFEEMFNLLAIPNTESNTLYQRDARSMGSRPIRRATRQDCLISS